MSDKKVFLIRHGETAWSLSGKHTGYSDIPLTENGKKQAILLGKALSSFSFSIAFVSPLIRAKDTFTLSHLSTPSCIDPNLIEWNYGKYEGITSDEIHKTNPSWNLFTHGAPDGESLSDIEKRADSMIEKALSAEGDVALFSSGHILRSIAARWLKMEVNFGGQLVLETGSISILGYEHGTRALLQWNSKVSI
jgi:probable phosphoglycerate mutase